MTRRLLLFTLSCFFFYNNVFATGIIYSIGFTEPQAHYTDVSMELEVGSSDSTDFKMPVWIPGSYMVREFPRMVESFTAAGTGGNQLKWKKVSKNSWRVYHAGNGTIKVSYRVYCFELTVRTSFVDHDRALLNGSSVFMYTEQHRNDSCQLRITPVSHWKVISTGMSQAGSDPFVRHAAGFDELIDCPILLGNHVVFSFEMKGIPHKVAMMGKANYDSVQIKKDLLAITTECTRIFGSNPVKDYTFIVIVTPTGGGGLEHCNSTVIHVSSPIFDNPSTYKGFLSLSAHEYFHLWLVKRIRDFKLGPFDYDNEVYTRQLWLYEGFTSFYDDYILFRTGIYPENEYLDIVRGNMSTVFNTPGNKYQSLAESSFDAWIKYYRRHENSNNSTVSYYVKGGVLGLMMHLDLLNRSQGVKSLDDLMRYLYNDHFLVNKVGLTDEQLQAAFDKVWGVPMGAYFDDYIYGTKDLPFEETLMYAGIRMLRDDGHVQKKGFIGATLSQRGDDLTVIAIDRNSPAWTFGLNVNDLILRADTARATSVKAYLDTKMPGDEVIFSFQRLGEIKSLMLIMGESDMATFKFEKIPKQSALQKKVYAAWMRNYK